MSDTGDESERWDWLTAQPKQLEKPLFDASDLIRAHGMGITIGEDEQKAKT